MNCKVVFLTVFKMIIYLTEINVLMVICLQMSEMTLENTKYTTIEVPIVNATLIINCKYNKIDEFCISTMHSTRSDHSGS